MKVSIDRNGAYSVSIQSDLTGPLLTISPSDAYKLLLALDTRREELYDLANNYVDCADCGNTHPKLIKVCPALVEEDE